MMCSREKSVALKLSSPVFPENFSEFVYRCLQSLVWKNRSLTDTIFDTEKVDRYGFRSDFNIYCFLGLETAFFLFLFVLEACSL